MTKVVRGAAALGVAALALAACGEAPEESGSGSGGTQAAGSDYQACLVSDAGGFDDRSFNESSAEGADAAKDELGVQTRLIESQSNADYEQNVDQTVQLGCDLTIGVGFNLADAVTQAAQNNPDLDYALVDATATVEGGLDNVKPLVFDTAQAAYLAGYLAAGTTETGKVATFGGMQIPSVTVFMDGFAEGVQRYNEDNGTQVQVLGWDPQTQQGTFTGDFDNQTNGVNVTQNFIDQGADIILPVAGPVGLGAASAAQGAEGVKVIWVDTDGYESAADYADLFLTSVVKEIDVAVEDAITAGVRGDFTSEQYVGTLENGGVGLAPYHDYEDQVPQELKDKIEQLREQIISGELTVDSPSSPTQG